MFTSRAQSSLEQDYLSGHPVLFTHRATAESESHWTPIDLEAARIVWKSRTFAVFFKAHRPVFVSHATGARKSRRDRVPQPTHANMLENIPHCTETRWNIVKAMPTEMPISILLATSRIQEVAAAWFRQTNTVCFSSAPTSFCYGGPSAKRVGLGGLASPNPTSGLGGLLLFPHDFEFFTSAGRE